MENSSAKKCNEEAAALPNEVTETPMHEFPSDSSLSDDEESTSSINADHNSSISSSEISTGEGECDDESTKSYHSSEKDKSSCSKRQHKTKTKNAIDSYRESLQKSDENEVSRFNDFEARSRFFVEKQSTANNISKKADPVPKEYQKNKRFIRNPSSIRSKLNKEASSAKMIEMTMTKFDVISNTNPNQMFINSSEVSSQLGSSTTIEEKAPIKKYDSAKFIKRNPYGKTHFNSKSDNSKKQLNHLAMTVTASSKAHAKQDLLADDTGYKKSAQRTIVFNMNDEDETEIALVEPVVRYFTKTTLCKQCIRIDNLIGTTFRSFFNFEYLNIVQSQVANDVFGTSANIVVSAPTGAGKTCIFEMAIVRLLMTNIDGKSISKQSKVVYIAPNKALCDERMHDWSNRFSALGMGIKVGLVTGDVWDTNEAFQSVVQSHIILTTPEKWDSVTRRWTDHLSILQCIKLLLVDEVHLLGDSTRGPCLETVICRMKTVRRATSSVAKFSCSSHDKLRIVAVSATLPNIVDIAIFLEATKSFFFDSSYRPVPLTTHVLGFGWVGKNQYLFDRGLNKYVPEVVSNYSNNKPTIIFCHTKKETEDMASSLANSIFSSENRQLLAQISAKASIQLLQKCIRQGTAYHHAGIDSLDRQVVEQAFATGAIRCLCATSTLAMGVNLPAHLVIVKGTSAWRGAGIGHEEIDRGTLLQMMGRAGRPGYDTEGVAVIMTDNSTTTKYQAISNGMEIVESNLMGRIAETINTEVSQKVIRNVSQAIAWMKGTYFFVRVRKNPPYYGMQGKTEEQMNAYLKETCMGSLNELNKAEIISVRNGGVDIVPLPASHIMSQHLVPFADMKRVMALSYDCGTREILLALSECEGLHRPVRRSEKRLLNDVYKQIKYKYDGPQSKIKIQKSNQKAFVLLQAAIGQLYLEDFTLRQEMTFTVDYATRILMAAEDYSIEGSKHGLVALDCLLLRRSLASSLWGNDDGILNQLPGVGAKTTERLKESSIKSFDDVIQQSTFTLENITNRRSPFGQELRDAAHTILKNSLKVRATIEDGESGQKLIICRLQKRDVRRTPGLANVQQSNSDNIVSYTLIVYHDRPGGLLMFRKFINSESSHRIPCPGSFNNLFVKLVANLVGLDSECVINGDSPRNNEISLSSTTPKLTKKVKQVKQRSYKLQNENNQEGEQISIDNMRGVISKCKVSTRRTTPLPSIAQSFKQSSSVTPSPKPFTSSATINDNLSLKTKTSNKAEAISEGMTDTIKLFENFPPPKTSTDETENQKRKVVKSIPTPSYPSYFKTSWQQQKKTSKSIQQNAYSSPKSNPFASFKFDPNHAESQLDKLAQESSKILQKAAFSKEGEQSIMQTETTNPPTYFSRIDARSIRTFAENLRTPARHGMANSIRKRKRELYVNNQDLLRLKAHEQNRYARGLIPNTSQHTQQSDRTKIHQHPFHQSTHFNLDPNINFLSNNVTHQERYNQNPIGYQNHSSYPNLSQNSYYDDNSALNRPMVQLENETPSSLPQHFLDTYISGNPTAKIQFDSHIPGNFFGLKHRQSLIEVQPSHLYTGTYDEDQVGNVHQFETQNHRQNSHFLQNSTGSIGNEIPNDSNGLILADDYLRKDDTTLSDPYDDKTFEDAFF